MKMLMSGRIIQGNRLIAALSDELYAIDTGICDAEKKLDFKVRLEYHLSTKAVKLKGQFELIKKITDMTPQDILNFFITFSQTLHDLGIFLVRIFYLSRRELRYER